MLCWKCSSDVGDTDKRCSSCGAILPLQAPTASPSGSLPLREGITYLRPRAPYRTPAIDRLSSLVGRLLQGEELFEELEDHLQEMARKFAEFDETHVSDMQALLTQESLRFPDDETNLQLSYLLQRGSQLFEEGCQMFDTFFDSESEDADELQDAFDTVREGHDYLCLSLELAQGRLAELQSVLKYQQRDTSAEAFAVLDGE